MTTFHGFKNILMTTDFSEVSNDAYTYALSMAQKYDAALHIVHVVDISSDAAGFYLPHLAFENLDKEMEESAKKMLKEKFSTKTHNLKSFEYVVLMGSPDEEIITFAEGIKADLLIMGSQGRSGIERMVFGSTTERVMRKAKCPVLSIHHTNS